MSGRFPTMGHMWITYHTIFPSLKEAHSRSPTPLYLMSSAWHWEKTLKIAPCTVFTTLNRHDLGVIADTDHFHEKLKIPTSPDMSFSRVRSSSDMPTFLGRNSQETKSKEARSLSDGPHDKSIQSKHSNSSRFPFSRQNGNQTKASRIGRGPDGPLAVFIWYRCKHAPVVKFIFRPVIKAKAMLGWLMAVCPSPPWIHPEDTPAPIPAKNWFCRL